MRVFKNFGFGRVSSQVQSDVEEVSHLRLGNSDTTTTLKSPFDAIEGLKLASTTFVSLPLTLIIDPWKKSRTKDDGLSHTLYHFHTKQDFDCWTILTDKAIGGKSVASLSANADGTGGLFEGHLSKEIPTSETVALNRTIKNIGYAAMITKDLLQLQDYNAIQMRVKTDGGLFFSQIRLRKCNFVSAQMNQGFVVHNYQSGFGPPSNQWVTLQFPFQHFIQTSYTGQINTVQSPILPSIQEGTPKGIMGEIIGLGILVSRDEPGPFRLEIDEIRAIRWTPPATRYQVEQEEEEEERNK